MQGLMLRRQLHQKQKEMLNLVVEQQQKQLQYLEMLKLQHFHQKQQQQRAEGEPKHQPEVVVEEHDDDIVDLTVSKNKENGAEEDKKASFDKDQEPDSVTADEAVEASVACQLPET